MSQGNSDVSALVKAELTCAAENVPFTPGQARACTVREVLDRVGGKWSIGILVAASHGPGALHRTGAHSRASAAGCSR